MRLWARRTSDNSKAFTRIRDAVAALPVDSAVLRQQAPPSTARPASHTRPSPASVPSLAGLLFCGGLPTERLIPPRIRVVASGRTLKIGCGDLLS